MTAPFAAWATRRSDAGPEQWTEVPLNSVRWAHAELVMKGFNVAGPVLDMRGHPEQWGRLDRGHAPSLKRDPEGRAALRADQALLPRLTLPPVDADVDDPELSLPLCARISTWLLTRRIYTEWWYSGSSGRVHLEVPQLDRGSPDAVSRWGAMLHQMCDELGLVPGKNSRALPGDAGAVDLRPTDARPNTFGRIVRLRGGKYKTPGVRKRAVPPDDVLRGYALAGLEPPPELGWPRGARTPLASLPQLPEAQPAARERTTRPRRQQLPIEVLSELDRAAAAGPVRVARALASQGVLKGIGHEVRLYAAGACSNMGLPSSFALALARELVAHEESREDAFSTVESTYQRARAGLGNWGAKHLRSLLDAAAEPLLEAIRMAAEERGARRSPPAAATPPPRPQAREPDRDTKPANVPEPTPARKVDLLARALPRARVRPSWRDTVTDALHDLDMYAEAEVLNGTFHCGVGYRERWTEAGGCPRQRLSCHSRWCAFCERRVLEGWREQTLQDLDDRSLVLLRVRVPGAPSSEGIKSLQKRLKKLKRWFEDRGRGHRWIGCDPTTGELQGLVAIYPLALDPANVPPHDEVASLAQSAEAWLVTSQGLADSVEVVAREAMVDAACVLMASIPARALRLARYVDHGVEAADAALGQHLQVWRKRHRSRSLEKAGEGWIPKVEAMPWEEDDPFADLPTMEYAYGVGVTELGRCPHPPTVADLAKAIRLRWPGVPLEVVAAQGRQAEAHHHHLRE